MYHHYDNWLHLYKLARILNRLGVKTVHRKLTAIEIARSNIFHLKYQSDMLAEGIKKGNDFKKYWKDKV